MKKILLISDIHGSLKAMKKIEEIILSDKFDKIICLGDILYHGPRNDLPDEYNPKKVIEIIKKYKDRFIFIQGNCDAEVDSMVLDCHFIKRKKINFSNRLIYFTHGHHLSKYNVDDSIEKNSIVIYGHYHIYDLANINDVFYLNIGSTSIPKDGICQYGVLDEEKISVFSLYENRLIGEYYL